VLGSAGDTDLALSNVQALRTPWINLCGATTLLQAAALISRGRMVVGAETGLVHMAAALGVPNAALVGGGHPGRFMPIAACTTIACLPLTCYQCDWRCSYEQCHCITDFHPYVLEVAIEHVLQHPKETGHVFVQASRGFLEQTGGPTWAPLAMDCFDSLPRSVMEITPPGPSNRIAAALFGEGAKMARQGERTKALHLFNQALTFEPSSWEIQRAIAWCGQSGLNVHREHDK